MATLILPDLPLPLTHHVVVCIIPRAMMLPAYAFKFFLHFFVEIKGELLPSKLLLRIVFFS